MLWLRWLWDWLSDEWRYGGVLCIHEDSPEQATLTVSQSQAASLIASEPRSASLTSSGFVEC